MWRAPVQRGLCHFPLNPRSVQEAVARQHSASSRAGLHARHVPLLHRWGPRAGEQCSPGSGISHRCARVCAAGSSSRLLQRKGAVRQLRRVLLNSRRQPTCPALGCCTLLTSAAPCCACCAADESHLDTRLEGVIALFLALTAVQFVVSGTIPTSSYVSRAARHLLPAAVAARRLGCMPSSAGERALALHCGPVARGQPSITRSPACSFSSRQFSAPALCPRPWPPCSWCPPSSSS